MADPLQDFVSACERNDVIVLGKAETSARIDFRLASKRDIVTFIGDGNLEDVQYVDEKPFRANTAFIVYAYSFYSGRKYGYMAIFCGEKQKWFLKSFKKNWGTGPRCIPLSQPLALIAKIGELK